MAVKLTGTIFRYLLLLLLMLAPWCQLTAESPKVSERKQRLEILEKGQQLVDRADLSKSAVSSTTFSNPFVPYTGQKAPAPVAERPEEDDDDEPEVVRPRLPDLHALKIVAHRIFKSTSALEFGNRAVLVTKAGQFKTGDSFVATIQSHKYRITVTDVNVNTYTIKINNTTLTNKHHSE